LDNIKLERLYARISDSGISEQTKQEMVDQLTPEEKTEMCLFIIEQMEKDIK